MRHMRLAVVLGLAFILVGSSAMAQRFYAESNTARRTVVGGKVIQSERDEQQEIFDYYFEDQNLEYQTKFDELPTEASVPAWRIPYSASIHSLRGGGLTTISRRNGTNVLSLYDQAFNDGADMANGYETRRLLGGGSRGLFPRLRIARNVQGWEGYCSGLTASTIRHPEPMKAVDAGQVGGRRGVVFQPSDIKALLSCIYNRTTDDSYLYLAPASARDRGPNMGTFHLALGNYIGRAGHPVGIDRTKGEESWNNPIYYYKVESIRDAGEADGFTYKTLHTTIIYSFYGSDGSVQTDAETGERHGNVRQAMSLRYTIALDSEGRICGGQALSHCGEFLWIPLYAPQATRDAKVQGNPYIDVRKVLAMARLSALPEIQKKYDEANIGPGVDPDAAKNRGEKTPDENVAKPETKPVEKPAEKVAAKPVEKVAAKPE